MFERRLIEKYIAENGTDPISGEQISEEQLIDIKGEFQRYCIVLKVSGHFAPWLGHSKSVQSNAYDCIYRLFIVLLFTGKPNSVC